MDLSEMLASPPTRPTANRPSSESVDQSPDTAFAAAVDAAESETSGEPRAKNGERTQTGPQEAEVAREPSGADTKASDKSQADAPQAGPGTVRAPEVAAASSQPDIDVLSAQKQTGAQPTTRQAQPAPTTVVASGNTRRAHLSQPVQVEESNVATTVEAEAKPTQTSQADSKPKAATLLQPARPGNDGLQPEVRQTINEGKPAVSTESKLEQPQPTPPSVPVRAADTNQRKPTTERVAAEPEFRVTVQRTTSPDAPEQAAAKPTNPQPAVQAPLPDNPRTTSRARSSADQVQVQKVEADLPTEAPKPSTELKITPDLPTRRVVTQSQGTVVSTSMTTSANPLGAAPVQGSQLQTAALPSVALIDQNAGLVETRIGPQLTAAAGTRSNGGVVEVLLEPPELGRVEIQMELSDQGLRATLAAERQATTDLLRRNLEVLAQQFEDAGFADVDLDFASFGDGQLAYEQDGSEAAQQGPENDAVVSQKSGAQPSRMGAHDGVVDIRL